MTHSSKHVGIFCISLDFELHWGIFDNHSLSDKEIALRNTREVIPKMLSSFEKHNVEATWASVGMMFNNSIEEVRTNYPTHLPSYSNKKLSSYNFLETEVKDQTDPYYIAKDLLEHIKKTPGQEIGTHTYSHYYALEEGQTQEEFNADLAKCNELAEGMGVKLESIVFPRHQVNEEYYTTCVKNGIHIIRTNPTKWPWLMKNNHKLSAKIARSLDCYVPVFNNNVTLEALKEAKKEHFLVPASRFLRPAIGSPFANKLRIRRIKGEMTRAAKKNEYYHLWWHPHNFGNTPEKAMEELDDILSHYSHLKERYQMTSLNMKNLYAHLN